MIYSSVFKSILIKKLRFISHYNFSTNFKIVNFIKINKTMDNYSYDTVSEAINELAKRGYTTDFKILSDEECIICSVIATQLNPEEFVIDEVYRFEGDTDPGDEMIIYAISSINHDIKGILLNGYGMYSDAATAKIVKRLKIKN